MGVNRSTLRILRGRLKNNVCIHRLHCSQRRDATATVPTGRRRPCRLRSRLWQIFGGNIANRQNRACREYLCPIRWLGSLAQVYPAIVRLQQARWHCQAAIPHTSTLRRPVLPLIQYVAKAKGSLRYHLRLSVGISANLKACPAYHLRMPLPL